MSPDIMKRYLRVPTAREIWSSLSKTFYDGNDEMQVYTLNLKAFSAKQGTKALSIYYGELTEIFQELDHRDKVSMKDPEDVTAYHKSIERIRVHIFLAGLDKSFDHIRREILHQTPRPSLEECYSIVRREDLRSITFNEESMKTEASAMLSGRQRNQISHDHQKSTNTKNFGVDKASLKCTHYNQTGHTKNHCFELIGYPDWWDPNRHRNSKRPSTSALTQSKENVGPSTSAVMATTTGEDPSNDWLWY